MSIVRKYILRLTVASLTYLLGWLGVFFWTSYLSSNTIELLDSKPELSFIHIPQTVHSNENYLYVPIYPGSKPSFTKALPNVDEFISYSPIGDIDSWYQEQMRKYRWNE